jgi:hypothetical protein
MAATSAVARIAIASRSVVTGSIGLACPLREGLVGIRVLMMLG